MAGEVVVIEPADEVARRPVGRFRERGGAGEIRDGAVGAQGRPLKHGREKAARPLPRADLRHTARVGDGDKRREIVALAPQGVGGPGPHARETVEREARCHLALGRPVRVRLRRHRMDEAHPIGKGTQAREQVARHRAALATGAKLPLRLDEVALFPLERDQLLP